MTHVKKSLKVVLLPIFFVALTLFLNSCSKDEVGKEKYECSTCVDSPDALAANDNSGKGIYKGVIIGSSGSIFIDIQNDSNTITAKIVLDGTTINLTSNVSYVEGEPYIAPFQGSINGNPLSVTFSVGLNGSNPTMISSDIPGHPNAVFTIYKESSTSLIEAFEGEFTVAGETGTFNIVLSRGINKWAGIAKKNTTGSEASEIDGTINSNNELTDSENGKKVGKITGDSILGSFKDENDDTVTVNGQRTL